MGFGNFSFWEILLIFVVVLLLFGAKRIPEIAGSMGKGIREFKRSLSDVERSVTEPERPRQASRASGQEALREPGLAATEKDAEEKEPRRLLG
jgi:sec-independent protein translocase protein TatA